MFWETRMSFPVKNNFLVRSKCARGVINYRIDYMFPCFVIYAFPSALTGLLIPCRSASPLWAMETSSRRRYWVVSSLSSALLLESSLTACLYLSSSTSSQTITLNSSPISTQHPRRNEGKWDLPRGQWKSLTNSLENIIVRNIDFICAFDLKNALL